MYASLQCVEKLLEAKADIDTTEEVSGGGGGVLLAVSGWRSEREAEREAMRDGVRLVVGELCVMSSVWERQGGWIEGGRRRGARLC